MLLNNTVKHGIAPSELAQEMGFRLGDKIEAVNGKTIIHLDDALNSEILMSEKPYYTVKRNDSIIDVKLPDDFLKKLTKKTKGAFFTPRMELYVQKVNSGSAAEKAGLQPKDKIIGVDTNKIILFEEGFKLSDCVLLLDADHVVREVNDFNNIDIKILEPGIYPQLMWKHPNECSFENFILGKTPRVPYGVEYKRYCESLNLNLEKVFLIQESFVLIKKNEKIYDFLLIWEKLAKFCEDQDLKRNQHILGYGEGYSLGVSIRGADLKIFESNQVVNNIIKNFKHLAWEK
jgi:hypothetical protein